MIAVETIESYTCAGCGVDVDRNSGFRIVFNDSAIVYLCNDCLLNLHDILEVVIEHEFTPIEPDGIVYEMRNFKFIDNEEEGDSK